MKDHVEQREAATAVEAAQGDLPSRSQSIRIMGFVDGDVIPPACYDEPYRLEPEKKDTKAYDALREIMHRTRKVGLAAVVIEKKQALAAVIPIGRTLVLNVLRFASGLVPGARRQGDQPGRAESAMPALSATVQPMNEAPTRRSSATTSAPRAVARIASARKSGEVIDLAVRRSSKRAQARPAKPRSRSSGVATLHQLRRKGAGRGQVGRQLA